MFDKNSKNCNGLYHNEYPLIILNIGPLEHFSTWDIHNEGTQKSILKVIFALDNERINLRKKLNYKSPHFNSYGVKTEKSRNFNSKGKKL